MSDKIEIALASCHGNHKTATCDEPGQTLELRIALGGNANVGKSAIFNQLTGLNQVVGNWPGKTVERAEGILHFEGRRIRVIDLPGIYSLSTFSIEEIVSRDYIAVEKPDAVINVVDASALERNLYFTLQLLELEAPVTIALNQVDFAAKKGLRIDVDKLSQALGVPVVPTVAITGHGIKDLLATVVAEATVGKKTQVKILYGREIEKKVSTIKNLIVAKLPELCTVYPARWLAIKLLEKDKDILAKVGTSAEAREVLERVEKLALELERVHGEQSSVIVASERYSLASKIAKNATVVEAKPNIGFEQKLDSVTTHGILGYLILAGVVAATFTVVFVGGNFFSILLDDALSVVSTGFGNFLSSFLPSAAVDLILKGAWEGLVAGITIALPYIVPFYVVLALLEDSGYLPRAAFLMDNVMHKIGLHGKAFIPMMLGYGCSVPGCIGCRIMETERERLLAAFVVVLIPCAARTVVILGTVGRFVGLPAAIGLYAFDLALVFVLGRIAFKALPGEPVGLIMEMPSYKKPSFNGVVLKTWVRTKDFVYMAFPIIVVGSLILTALAMSGLLAYVTGFSAPLITGWLGLPSVVAFPLIFGILRKELTLVLLSSSLASVGLGLQSLTAVQLIVFALVVMIYFPCVATIAACKREFGWKKTLTIAAVDIGLALLLGGVAYRFLSLVLPK